MMKKKKISMFERSKEILNKHVVMTSTLRRINEDKEYDSEYAEQICQVIYKMLEYRESRYDQALDMLVKFSIDFLKQQIELEKTKKYTLDTFDQAKQQVYDCEEEMTKYLYGLLFSQAFWVNHYKIQQFYMKEFCNTGLGKGRVMEAPTGTGIFLKEFLDKNPAWEYEGYDISEYSVRFTKNVLKHSNYEYDTIKKRDILTFVPEKKYDRIICGELLEHIEEPSKVLDKMTKMIMPNGQIFLTTAIFASNIDHIYMFHNVQEVRDMIKNKYKIVKELALPVFSTHSVDETNTPINYACILEVK